MNLVYRQDPFLEGCEVVTINKEGELPPCVNIGKAYGRATRPEILGSFHPSGQVQCSQGCHTIEVVDQILLPSGAKIKVFEN